MWKEFKNEKKKLLGLKLIWKFCYGENNVNDISLDIKEKVIVFNGDKVNVFKYIGKYGEKLRKKIKVMKDREEFDNYEFDFRIRSGGDFKRLEGFVYGIVLFKGIKLRGIIKLLEGFDFNSYVRSEVKEFFKIDIFF